MKKPAFPILVVITCVFVAFTAGFFMGRSLNRTPVRIWQSTSVTEEPTQTEPTAPAIVNINTATAAQLEDLPGIGPVLAQRIIAYRDANGPFRAVEELTKVEGIGEKKLEDILDLITVGG